MSGQHHHPLARIRFVMVETTHTGNMGATARAMKAMGLTRLDLVRPKHLPDAEAVARASGADDLLAAARVHDSLVGALAGCRLVVGSSARLRRVEWPLLEPRESGETLVREAAAGDVALVLGRESSGLTNEELQLCHYLAHIPTDPGFGSLNVAAAAQVFAYEVRRAFLVRAGQATPGAAGDVAPAEVLDGFHEHLARTLVEIGFADPEQAKKLGRRLRRLFNRARPDRTEINILRGILSAAQGRKDPGRFRRTDGPGPK
jgi:tRNA (cytidine32/uridine32-2'-O)-methyltransferase